MRGMSENGVGDRRTLAAAFRRIRRRRRLRTSQVAVAMDLPLRTYQHLEAGRGHFYIEDLQGFARATDSDPLALLLAGTLRAPDFAEHAADLKLATLGVLFIEDLNRALGEDLSRLSAANVMSALQEAIADLKRQAAAAPVPALDPPPRVENLTGRQLECLAWVRKGKSSVDIGHILGISSRTVDDHIIKACRWLGVRTRVQAVEAALSLGLLQTYP